LTVQAWIYPCISKKWIQTEFSRFQKIYSDWDAVYDKKGWGTIYLGNHDQPRMTSGEMTLLNTENYHLKCYLPSYYQ
jgi:glycosidase